MEEAVFEKLLLRAINGLVIAFIQVYYFVTFHTTQTTQIILRRELSHGRLATGYDMRLQLDTSSLIHRRCIYKWIFLKVNVGGSMRAKPTTSTKTR
jgi:hypothetical protein